MQHNSDYFTGLYDTKIFYQTWTPDNPKGVVLVIHGYGEHSGRYMNVVDTLVPEGYAIWALDHRGHGKSEGKRCHVNRFTNYFDDLRTLEQMARAAHPDLPFHLVGHSMGSIIANNYLAQADQSTFKSMTLSGTGAKPGPEIGGFQIILSKIFTVIAPKMSIPSGLDPNFISHDEKVVEDYINDPLVENKITPRLGNEMMIYLGKMIPSAETITIPILMQLGSEDTSFHPDSWDALYAAFKSENKDFKKYDGYRHEVYNEVKKEVPLEDLKNWINTYN